MKSNRTSQFLQYEMNKNRCVSIPRSLFDENMTYKVHIKGQNALGESHSNFTFSIRDIGKRLNYSFLKHFLILIISLLSKSGFGMFWHTKCACSSSLNHILILLCCCMFFIYLCCFCSVIPSTPKITQVVFENGGLSPTIYWNGSDDVLKPSLRFRSAHNDQDWVRVRWFKLVLV